MRSSPNLEFRLTPLGPSKPTHVPSGTSRSRWSTAVIGPYRLTTPRSWMTSSRVMRSACQEQQAAVAVSPFARACAIAASRAKRLVLERVVDLSAGHGDAERAELVLHPDRVAVRGEHLRQALVDLRRLVRPAADQDDALGAQASLHSRPVDHAGLDLLLDPD